MVAKFSPLPRSKNEHPIHALPAGLREGEVCSEISDLAARLNVAGYAKAKAATACAEFVCTEEDGTPKAPDASGSVSPS